jgi:Uma2 family endonuclease
MAVSTEAQETRVSKQARFALVASTSSRYTLYSVDNVQSCALSLCTPTFLRDRIMSQAANRPRHIANRAAFHTWAMGQPGRFERLNGEVIAMAPERLGHVRIKARVWRALEDAIEAAGVTCEALSDGATVEIDDTTDFEPDALVNCGPPPSDERLSAPNPVVVVEVLSPATRLIDTGAKLTGYFRVAAVRHYLIVNAQKPEIIHHKRNADGTVLTEIVTSGGLRLDPPGLALHLDQIYRKRP